MTPGFTTAFEESSNEKPGDDVAALEAWVLLDCFDTAIICHRIP